MAFSRRLHLPALAMALAGCEGLLTPGQNSGLDGVVISDPPRALAVGEEHQLDARGLRRTCDIEFCSDDLVPTKVTWESSDPVILEVLPSGLLRARQVGTATIRARHDGFTATAGIRVGAERIPLVIGMGGTCGLAVEGQLYCWGLLGQQGAGGEDLRRLEPIRLPAPPLASISSSGTTGCGVLPDGAVYCWSATTPPTELPGLRLRYVSAGPPSVIAEARHACGVTSEGEAWCWRTDVIPAMQATQVPGGLAFASISAGGRHDCAVSTTKQVYCWGKNEWGQLGRDTGGESRTEPQLVEGLPPVSKVVAGENHTCALGEDHLAWCWGSNYLGYLGHGKGWDNDPHPTPVAVPDAPELVSLDGTRIICGLTRSGQAFCWGHVWSAKGLVTAPDFRALGAGVVASGLTGSWYSSIHLEPMACGQATDGVVYCWGIDLKPERIRGPIT